MAQIDQLKSGIVEYDINPLINALADKFTSWRDGPTKTTYMYKDPNVYFLENPPYERPDDYYKAHEQAIIALHKKKPGLWYDSYPFDWVSVFTPIEMDAWCLIRGKGGMVLYPQYPVLNYRLDFGNPALKIGFECDGKDFHDINRDYDRDQRLWEAGWRIFRCTGSELHRTMEYPEYDEYDDNWEKHLADLCAYYHTTAEGVLDAIRAYYFRPDEFRRMHEADDPDCKYMIDTLDLHRLVNFPL